MAPATLYDPLPPGGSALPALAHANLYRCRWSLRAVWDPNADYETYAFVRQPQTFPDVVLRKQGDGADVLMGIELKGWYLLAKEEMPTYRFTVSEGACNPRDLLVVVPWVLSNVPAGTPVLHRPFVELARYCAQKRNYYWPHERKATGELGDIVSPQDVHPYPAKSDNITDKAAVDSGGNFGRLARYGLMTTYVKDIRNPLVRGIAVQDGQKFLVLPHFRWAAGHACRPSG